MEVERVRDRERARDEEERENAAGIAVGDV